MSHLNQKIELIQKWIEKCEDVDSLEQIINDQITPLLKNGSVSVEHLSDAATATFEKIDIGYFINEFRTLRYSVDPSVKLNSIKQEISLLLTELNEASPADRKDEERLRYIYSTIIWQGIRVSINENCLEDKLCEYMFSTKQPDKGIHWSELYFEMFDDEALDEEKWRKVDQAVRRIDRVLKDKGMKPIFIYSGGRQGCVRFADSYKR